MSFTTASAILRGVWLIDPAYARAQMPLVLNLISKGEFDFGKGNTGGGGDFVGLYKQRLEKLPQSLYMPKKRSFASIDGGTDVYSVSPYVSTDRLPYNSIAMVDILGPVLKYGDYCTYGTVEYNDLLIRLANSNRVAGIILNIDSPGGQADGTAMFAQTIREVAKNSKPIIAVVQDGIAASAAMWIASAAQEIYLTQSTDQVGSIGAYTLIYDYAGMLEQLGIKEHLIMAPQSVDKIKDYLDALKGDYTLIQEDLKYLVNDFVSAVKTGRGQRLNTANDNPFTGKMYRTADAKKIGLIDGQKSFNDVVKRMEQLIRLRA
jgi:protease-4